MAWNKIYGVNKSCKNFFSDDFQIVGAGVKIGKQRADQCSIGLVVDDLYFTCQVEPMICLVWERLWAVKLFEAKARIA